MSYRLISANNIVFNSGGFITAENIEKMPCIYADLPNGMDGEHYVFEQEQKIGHWICTIEDWNKWTCSECGFCKRTDIHVSLGYNYCPNCGAKMESDDNQYSREKCCECCNKNKSVLDMPCCKCSAENDYVYFNAHDWEYESMEESEGLR